MDSSKEIEKCLKILANDQFVKINDDPANPTKRIDSKIHKCVHRLKSKTVKDEYSKLYLAWFNPEKLYEAYKIHALFHNDTTDQLLLTPIVFNVGTASYYLPKCLVKLLSPLSQSEYTLGNP